MIGISSYSAARPLTSQAAMTAKKAASPVYFGNYVNGGWTDQNGTQHGGQPSNMRDETPAGIAQKLELDQKIESAQGPGGKRTYYRTGKDGRKVQTDQRGKVQKDWRGRVTVLTVDDKISEDPRDDQVKATKKTAWWS